MNALSRWKTSSVEDCSEPHAASDSMMCATAGACEDCYCTHPALDMRAIACAARSVVLWFYPEGDMFNGNNLAEASGFQKLLDEYTKLDAVVIACSTQTAAQQRSGLMRRVQDRTSVRITYPFLSDAQEKVSAPFGAKSPLGGTSRQTFIIDPSGTLRWQETNIEFGIGEFNPENHPKRVLRELFQVHNTDGWSV